MIREGVCSVTIFLFPTVEFFVKAAGARYFIHLNSTLLGYYHHHLLHLPKFSINSILFFNSSSHYRITHLSLYHLLSSAIVPTFCVLYYMNVLFFKTYNEQCISSHPTSLFFMPLRCTWYITTLQYNTEHLQDTTLTPHASQCTFNAIQYRSRHATLHRTVRNFLSWYRTLSR